MAVISDIEIRLRADIARLQQDMTRARQSVTSATDAMRKSLFAFAAGFSLINIAQQVVAAQREFDKLNSSLITATGSAKSAGEAMKALQDFAARTPFSLQEVTEGFLKLRNLGLTPSERALESYGNTSAAMGKNLMQLVEAVADATTGEFERLKEFGIKAKQQGDSVALTFQGTTTKIGNNAAEIEEYLTRIGEVNFAGGMARQANTLDGDLSRLGDTWDQTLVAFSQSGFGDAVRSAVGALSESLQDLGAIFKSVTSEADAEGKKVDELNGVHFLLTTTFETLAVLGLNVAFAFKAVGRNIGAVAAAVANPTQAIEILKQRFSDLGDEWDQVNKDSDRVLKAAGNARAAQAAQDAAQTGDRLAQYKIVGDAAKTTSDAEVKAAAKAKGAYDAFMVTLQARVDETAREAAGLAALTTAEKAHLDLTEQIRAGKLKLTKEQERAARSLIDEAGANDVLIRSNKEYKDLQQQLADNAKALAADRMSLIESARQEAERNEDLVRTYGMSEAAITRMQAARLLEQEAQRLGRDLTAEEIEDLQRVIALKERSAAAVASRAELEKTKEFWKSIDDTARATFTSIADGGKSAFQRLKDTAKNTFFDWLYQQTLKKWIINIQANSSGASSIVGALSSASGGSGGGLSSIGNLLSIGKTIYSGFTTGLAGTLGSWVSSAGSLFGSQAVSAFGAGLTGSSLGATTALGSSGYAGTAAAGAGASAGAYAIPIAGWIAAGMTVANRLYKSGWDATNGTLNTAGKVFGSSILAFNSVLKKIGLSNSAANIFSGQATLSKLFGRKNPEIERQGIQGTFNTEGFAGKAFADILEKGGWFRSDKRYTKLAALDQAQQDSFDSTITSMIAAVRGFGSVLGVEANAVDGYSKAIKLTFGKDEAENQKMIADLFATIGDELAVKVVPSITKFQQEGETAAATLQRVATNFAVVDGILAAMGVSSQTAFRAVGVASIEARERLIALSGGLEALASQTDFFNQNFLSQAEQIALIQGPLNQQLAALGLAGATTTEQFKTAVQTLVQSGALATEEGANRYAKLLAIAPQFKLVADYLAELDEAAADAAKELADAAQILADEKAAAALVLAADRRQLEIQIMELQGNALGALSARRKDELAAVDPSLRALYERIYALQDEKAAAEKAAEAIEQAASRMQNLGNAIIGAMDSAREAVKTLQDFSDSLKLGGLSGLSAEERYREAKRQFETADPSDSAAIQAFLQAAKDRAVDDFYYQMDYAAAQAKADLAVKNAQKYLDRLPDFYNILSNLTQPPPYVSKPLLSTVKPPVNDPAVATAESTDRAEKLMQRQNEILESLNSNMGQLAAQFDSASEGGQGLKQLT